jgi:hypothetical protein
VSVQATSLDMSGRSRSGDFAHGLAIARAQPVGHTSILEDDIPQVADLYWMFMQGCTGPAPSALQSFFRALHFTSPWIDSSTPSSLVFESERGRIVGFLGVISRKMSVCVQPIRVTCTGNFVVHPEARSNLAVAPASQTDSASNVFRTSPIDTLPCRKIRQVLLRH